MDPYSHGERFHGIGEEEEHHEKKPVLKKVKDKVKKIKNTISKKTHGHEHEHGHDHDYVSEEEEGYEEDENGREVDSEVHGTPIHESNAPTGILAGGHDENLGATRVGLGTIGRVGEDSVAPNSISTSSALSDYTHPVSPPSAAILSRGHDENLGPTRVGLGTTIGRVEEDYMAPNSISTSSAPSDYAHPVSPPSAVYESGASTGKPVRGHNENIEPEKVTLGTIIGCAEEDPSAPNTKSTTSAPSDHTKLSSSTGSDVVGESPIIGSFQAMVIADESKSEKEALQSPPPTGTHDQFSPEKESQHEDIKATSYTEKISSTATAAKEAAASAASTVYNKVSEAGTAVIGKVQSQGGPTSTEPSTGTSVKEFFVQKLRPGDEDRALSEVISEAIHIKKQETTDQSHRCPSETESSGGKGMVEKIKGVVTSFLGPGREGSGQQVGRQEQEHDDIKHVG